DVYNKKMKREFTECTSWRRQAIQRIIALRPKAVLLGNFAMREAKDVTWDGEYMGFSLPEWEAGLKRTISALAPTNAINIIINDQPTPGFDVPTCYSRAVDASSDPVAVCSFSRLAGIIPGLLSTEQAVASSLPRTRSLDLTDEFCGPTTCVPV